MTVFKEEKEEAPAREGVDGSNETHGKVGGEASTQSLTSINLMVEYAAATNRLLRVAVNGFFDSLRVVLQTMQELDVDTINIQGMEPLTGVQGVELEDS